MVYSTSKCPSCRQVIRTQRNPAKQIGIPFERCRYCGTTYRNSYKEEWITKSPIRRFFFFLQSGVWARAFCFPPLILVIPLIALDLSDDILWVLWPILSLAWLIGGYFLHKDAAQDDITASLERTKDPQYLSLLKQAGFSIFPIDGTTSTINTTTQTISNFQRTVAANSQAKVGVAGAVPPPVPVIAYHVVINRQAAGPFDLVTLQQMAVNGQLTAQSLVWKSGMPNWAAANSVDELKSLFVAPPPVPQVP